MTAKELIGLLQTVPEDSIIVRPYSAHPEGTVQYKELLVNSTFATRECGGTLRPYYSEAGKVPVVVFNL